MVDSWHTTIRPSEPDFWQCNSYYGTQLNVHDCYDAANQMPRTYERNQLYTVGGIGPYNIPWSSVVGNCEVAIEIGGPSPGTAIVLPTNFVHSYVSLGGYGTWGIARLINYINQEYDSSFTVGPVWAPSSAFITFSVRGIGKPTQPGNYDPGIALKIYQYSRQPASDGSGNVAPPHENWWYATYMEMFGNIIYGRGRETWWNTALSASSSPPNEMDYACRADLGSPNEGDCNQLEASQLGPPLDTVMIGPGSPKVLTTGSCSVDVGASRPISVTWGQIAVALGALLQLCITFGSTKVGGVANFHEAQPLPGASTLHLAGKRSTGGTQLSGLNALPPGINVTLSKTGWHQL